MGEWSWEAAFHGWVHTATLAVCTVLALFVLVLGSFGNGLVLLSAARRARLRSNFDLLLLNLSGADLLLCLVLTPLYLFTLFTDPPAPKVFCGSLLFGGTGCGLLSLLSLVAIAVHRQARVAGRAKRLLSRRQTLGVLMAVWGVSAVGAGGATLHAMLDWRASDNNCQMLLHSAHPLLHRFTLFFLGPVVFVSFVVIVFSYTVIGRAVRAQSRARTRGLSSVYRSTTIYRAAGGKQKDPLIPAAGRETGRELSRGVARRCQCCGCQAAAERDSKAVTMCLVVTVTLLLCWSPLLVSQFLELGLGSSITLLQVKLCGIALVFLNSALDPYMYAQSQGRSNTRYGRLLWQLLRCQCTGPGTSRFRTLAPPPAGPPRSSLLEADAPSLHLPDRAPNVKRDCRADTGGRVAMGVAQFPGSARSPHKLLTPPGQCGLCGPGLRFPANAEWQTVLNTPVPCFTNANTNTLTARVAATTTTTTTSVSSGHLCRTKDVIRDVRILVHKSCCTAHMPSDQSLVES